MTMFQEARQTAIDRTNANIENTSLPDQQNIENRSKMDQGNSSSESSNSSENEDNDEKTKISTKAVNADDDNDIIGPPLPSGLVPAEEEIGPPLPPGFTTEGSGEKKERTGRGDDDSDDESEEEEETLDQKIPSSHEITLNHGNKTVSALALDPSGARLITGGHDYQVKFYDFAGMDASLKHFRQIQPCESHPIKQLHYSSTGDKILVVSGSCKPKVLDRDGHEVLECMKGDPYINDVSNTKGHTAMVNGGCWNPKIREEFMTCSNDSSVRLWNVNTDCKKHKHIMKPKTQQGRKTIPTACCYSNDGRWVACGCQDGSIQIWDHNKNFVNVAMVNRTAHMNGTDTSSLCFSYDDRVLASRGGDDTVKLWDIRNFKKPLVVKDSLPNFFSVTDCLFSPDDKMVLTGISVRKGQGKGKLLFMDRQTLDTVTEMEISDASVVRCLWHPRLNQIVVGSADGVVKLFYDPNKSHRGALLCVVKKPRETKQVQVMSTRQIITPYALPMFKVAKQQGTRKVEEKLRKDPLKSMRPDLPINGPGEGGRLREKGATLSQYVVQSMIMKKPDKYENNPREAILRHAKEAAENPFWVDVAYQKTQPHKIFQQPEEEKDEDDDDHPLFKKAKMG